VTTEAIVQFSASDAALGHLYRTRLALLWSLRKLKTDADILVALTLDDVAFEFNGCADEMLQTKQHSTGGTAGTERDTKL
jgi:hypothetical protein